MKNLSQHILEAFVPTKGKSKTLQGLTFTYGGATHEIDYTEGDFVTTAKGKEFRISTLERNGVEMPSKSKPAKLISQSDYIKLCKEAVKDGGYKNAENVAKKLIDDPSILQRLEKDYPRLKKEELIDQLSNDIADQDGSYDAAVNRKSRGNTSNKLISTAEYQKICKSFASNGGAENAYDMAENAWLTSGVKLRLQKDYPGLSDSKLKQRLQWDIEAYS